LSESQAKKGEFDSDMDKVTRKIDQMAARSAYLKEEPSALQKALAELAASQAEMNKMRVTDQATYVKTKADLEQCFEGEYYAKACRRTRRQRARRQNALHFAIQIGSLAVVASKALTNLRADVKQMREDHRGCSAPNIS
jgi:succinate dehydrogenase/fumarate reductase flavoprotein subunit